MIQCAKCGNDTRTSGLVTEQGDVMVTGPFGTEPQPVLAQTCTACGYIELYAPQMVSQPEQQVAAATANVEAVTATPATA